MNSKEVENWLKAGHYMIQLFWPGYGEYSLASRWVGEWIVSTKFVVTTRDQVMLNNMKTQFAPDFDSGQFRSILKTLKGQQNNIGIAVMPFLFGWNVERFREYFNRQSSFNLNKYCNALGGFISANKSQVAQLRGKRLAHGKIDNDIEEFIERVKAHLRQIGVGQNEPVGAAKLLHILMPTFFPLVDNAIAEAMHVKQPGQTLTTNEYITWMERYQNWLRKHKGPCARAEKEFGLPILKLVDEGLYVMCTKWREMPAKAYLLGL